MAFGGHRCNKILSFTENFLLDIKGNLQKIFVKFAFRTKLWHFFPLVFDQALYFYSLPADKMYVPGDCNTFYNAIVKINPSLFLL